MVDGVQDQALVVRTRAEVRSRVVEEQAASVIARSRSSTAGMLVSFFRWFTETVK